LTGPGKRWSVRRAELDVPFIRGVQSGAFVI
jgi:hypothetical protein